MSQLEIDPKVEEPKVAEESAQLIDTSKMSKGKADALEMAEDSRDELLDYTSFAGSIFMGRLRWPLIAPFPDRTPEDKAVGDAWLKKFEAVLREKADPDQIDRDGEIPQELIDELAALGSFGIKIPKKYQGLGMSQATYTRAACVLGSHCGNLTALISAHQSIGVPQPLLVFGTEEQKQKYLPRVAQGEISAFALTEDSVGSDPARMTTTATPTEDGKHFIINGEKLWCTNGTRAGLLVVMAKTPDKIVRGKPRNQVSAFIVETDWPGVEVLHRCHFMGLRALYNGVIRFKDVKVPRENMIAGEGHGLRVALTTLNTGRLTIPGACIGMGKKALEILREWCNEREQWGASIGKHAAIADKIAHIASNTFAMEAMAYLTSGLVDKKKADIRLEAAMCKMWCTEAAWRCADEALQIRGGRGYETHASLKARGEKAIGIERWMRDNRINLIFEGSSEIMRLFIAREALDPHLKVAGAVLNSRLPMGKRLGAAIKAGLFYVTWYPKQWLPFGSAPSGMDSRLAKHARYAARGSRKLARTMYHNMLRFGPKLEEEQVLLARFVEIGTELFAISSTVVYAQHLIDNEGRDRDEVIALVDHFCKEAKLRIKERFRGVRDNNDREGYKLAQQVLSGEIAQMERGIVGRME